MKNPLTSLALVLIAPVILLGASTPAKAQPRGWTGGATIALETRYLQAQDLDATGDRRRAGSLGLNVRAMAGKSRLLYAAGVDYQLGGSGPGGFLYEANLFPLGAGVLLGPNAKLGLRAGVGLSGGPHRVQFSAQAPVELRLEFDLHSKVRVVSHGSMLWLSDKSRERGSPTLSFADETLIGLKLRLGKRYYPHDNRVSAGNGYFLGLLYQEQLGAALLGATFGYSLNASMGKF